jgi:hypothetical protein
MERFYKFALIIAIVFLIICLIGMGFLLQYQNAGMKFPEHPNACPDFWTTDVSGGGRCIVPDPSRNVGNITPWSRDLSYSYVEMGVNICDKYKWATQRKLNWDGVSNYNGCT